MNNAASLFSALATPLASASPSPSSLVSGLACPAQPGAEPSDSFGSMLADALPAQQPQTVPATPGPELAYRSSTAANPRALAQGHSTGDGMDVAESQKPAQPNWGKSIEVLTAKVAEQQRPDWAPQGLVRRLPELFAPVAAPDPDASIDGLCALPPASCVAALTGTPSSLGSVIDPEGAAEHQGSDVGPNPPAAQSPLPGDLSSDQELETPAPTASQSLRPGACPARSLNAHASAGLAKAVVHLQSNHSASLGLLHPVRDPAVDGSPSSAPVLGEERIDDLDTTAAAIPGAQPADAIPLTGALSSAASCDLLVVLASPPMESASQQAQVSLSDSAEAPAVNPPQGSASGMAPSISASSVPAESPARPQRRAQESGKPAALSAAAANKPDFAASGNFVPSLERPVPAQAAGSLPRAASDSATSADLKPAEAGVPSTFSALDARSDRSQAGVPHSHPADAAASQGSIRAVAAGAPASSVVQGVVTTGTPAPESPDLASTPGQQGGGQDRAAMNPASHERQGIPFGREQNTGNSTTAQASEQVATQAQALAQAATRSAVMRSYGVSAKASSTELPVQSRDTLPSGQLPAADSASGFVPSPSSAVSSGSGSSSRGGSDEHSSLAQGRSRQDGEKSAVQGLHQHNADTFSRAVTKEKNVQAIGAKTEAKSEKMAGIDDAKKGANMNSVPSSPVTTDVLPASRSTMDWVAEGLSRLGSGDTSVSVLAQSELAPHAKQLVERVEKALESLQSRPERVVRFEVGDSRDERLSVSLQLKDGVIHTTFAAGSTELRDLISREWSGSLGSTLGPEANLRVAEPVFTSSSRNENLDTGSQSQRQQQQHSQQGQAAGQQGQGFQRGPARAASVAAPEAAVQSLPSTSSSHRVLQAFA